MRKKKIYHIVMILLFVLLSKIVICYKTQIVEASGVEIDEIISDSIISIPDSCLKTFVQNSDRLFIDNQKQQQEVRNAYALCEANVKRLLLTQGVSTFELNIFIRIFKYERIVELWAAVRGSTQYTKVLESRICFLSGDLGPKRKQGDGQVPEGFYHINRYNPWSNYILSLGINYPNASDEILGYRSNLGGDIFIHGNCCSIGCVPLDTDIYQVYLFAVEAKAFGQDKIPVHIFPCKLTTTKLQELEEEYGTIHLDFWKNLKTGYDAFEKTSIIPEITVDENGQYIVNLKN